MNWVTGKKGHYFLAGSSRARDLIFPSCFLSYIFVKFRCDVRNVHLRVFAFYLSKDFFPLLSCICPLGNCVVSGRSLSPPWLYIIPFITCTWSVKPLTPLAHQRYINFENVIVNRIAKGVVMLRSCTSSRKNPHQGRIQDFHGGRGRKRLCIWTYVFWCPCIWTYVFWCPYSRHPNPRTNPNITSATEPGSNHIGDPFLSPPPHFFFGGGGRLVRPLWMIRQCALAILWLIRGLRPGWGDLYRP